MKKKEKVIKAISICRKTHSVDSCEGCPYRDDYDGFPRRDYGETSCVTKLLDDVEYLLNDKQTYGEKKAEEIIKTCF